MLWRNFATMPIHAKLRYILNLFYSRSSSIDNFGLVFWDSVCRIYSFQECRSFYSTIYYIYSNKIMYDIMQIAARGPSSRISSIPSPVKVLKKNNARIWKQRMCLSEGLNKFTNLLRVDLHHVFAEIVKKNIDSPHGRLNEVI